MKRPHVLIVPKKDSKTVIEKRFSNKTVKVEKKEEKNLEKEVIIAGDVFDTNRLRQTIMTAKAPVLERTTVRKRVPLEQEVPLVSTTPKKNDEDIKYNSRVEYASGRTANTDVRDVRYQNTAEYVTDGEKRKTQGVEPIDPPTLRPQSPETKRNFRGELPNPEYTARDEKRNAETLRRDVTSEYQVKKRKYE